MTYAEALDFLYTQLPMFQRVGAAAYKPGLDTSIALAEAFGNPHRRFRSIHVGGTNGKGSTSHTLAAILGEAGYRTGLYTSPHLVDFRERIRVGGVMIPEDGVIDFVSRFKDMHLDFHPSFFELTMVMAFEHFARSRVDAAVVEVGLGGRLDSTNIITPELSVITNISLDHTQFLGDTPEAIASEKAGIIKPGVPVVIGESQGGVRRVFTEKAVSCGSPIRYADDEHHFDTAVHDGDKMLYTGTAYGDLAGQLTGDCQVYNTATVLSAVDELKRSGWTLPDDAIRRGFADVCGLTGLAGRWMVTGLRPFTVCDTGHNVGGWTYLARQIAAAPGRKHLVIGFVNDKDVTHILEMMPKDARYYFTRASVPRALDADVVAALAGQFGLQGKAYPDVMSAVSAAVADAAPDDTVFIGGSTFVVADYLTSR